MSTPTPPAVREILEMAPADAKSYVARLPYGVLMQHYDGINLTENNHGKQDVIELVNLCGGEEDDDALEMVANAFGKIPKSIKNHLHPEERGETKKQLQEHVVVLQEQLRQQHQQIATLQEQLQQEQPQIAAATTHERTFQQQLQQEQQQTAAAAARADTLQQQLQQEQQQNAAAAARVRTLQQQLQQEQQQNAAAAAAREYKAKHLAAVKDAALKARTRMLQDQVYKAKHLAAVKDAALVAQTGADRIAAAVFEFELTELQFQIAERKAEVAGIMQEIRTQGRRLNRYREGVAEVQLQLSERQSTLEMISFAFEDDLVPQRLVIFIERLVLQLLNEMNEWEGIKLLDQMLEWHSQGLFVQLIEDLQRGDARIGECDSSSDRALTFTSQFLTSISFRVASSGLYFELFEFVTDKDGEKSELQVHFASLLGFIQPGGQSPEATQQLKESLKQPSMEWDEDTTRPLYKQLLGRFVDFTVEEEGEEVEDDEEQEEQGESAEGSHVAEREDADVQEEEGSSGGSTQGE